MGIFLNQEKLQHLNSITHEGKVLVVATDSEGKIFYTIKQDGFEDSYLNTSPEHRTGWETWQALELPDENEDPSVLAQESAELTEQNNPRQFVLKSRYKTQAETAVAPVQLIAALGYVYVFRQSRTNTLLVDRFVLDGMTNTLNRKLEVRFKRSQQKHKPLEAKNKGVNGLSDIDSLDFRNANGDFFYEPTTELCTINQLQQGWFSVVLVPTIENDVYRWHIFSYNSQTQSVELTTIRASKEGLFDIKDYTVFDEVNGTLAPRQILGVIKRRLVISGATVTNALAATKYDLQQEQQTAQAGVMQLIKTATRLMLVIPTDQGTAAFNFAIAGDGTLSQLDQTPTTRVLRSTQREILLPFNTLDQIKAIAHTTPPPQGIITGFSEGNEGNSADLVKISTQGAAGLDPRDRVKITGTSDYQGLYSAILIDENTFEIDLVESHKLGYWEKADTEASGLIFDGMITAYEKIGNGRLRVTCPNHALENGDAVQIAGMETYDSTYPIQKISDTQFVIERKWAKGEAINVEMVSRKRRGMVFDGKDDYIRLSPDCLPLGNELTITLWAKGGASLPKDHCLLFATDAENDRVLNIHLPRANEQIYFDCGNKGVEYDRVYKSAQAVEYKDTWTHWAFTKNAVTGTMRIYRNGTLWHTESGKFMPLVKTSQVYLASDGGTLNYDGTLAELCIWQVERTEAEIRNSMYLQLIGREVGLVGYWRLGAVADGKVVDFSVNSNDGIVHGDPYVSMATLNRTLINASQSAIKYSNPELFAVTERATYEESFEFKVNAETAINLDDVDGKGNRIFALAPWGKSSRSAEENTLILAVQDDFKTLDNGWYRATCRFTIPEQVSLVRSFEIDRVKGEWQSLEVRKHRIRLLSDSITEAQYTDRIDLKALSNSYQGSSEQVLKDLNLKEEQRQGLLEQKKELEFQIGFLTKSPSETLEMVNTSSTNVMEKEREINRLQENFNRLENDESLKRIRYETALSSKTTIYEDANYTGRSLDLGLGHHNLRDNFNDLITSVTVPAGLQVTLYEHQHLEGSSLQITESSPNISNLNDFNDKATTIVVEVLAVIAEEAIKAATDLQNDRVLLTQQQANLVLLRHELESFNALKVLESDKDAKQRLRNQEQKLKAKIEFLDALVAVKFVSTEVTEKEGDVSRLQENVKQLEKDDLSKRARYEEALSSKATVYEHIAYGGRSLELGVGNHNLHDYQFNDLLTSIKVPVGLLQVTLSQHSNKTGTSLTLTQDRDNVDTVFNDTLTGVVVEVLASVYEATVAALAALEHGRVLLKNNQTELKRLRQELEKCKLRLKKAIKDVQPKALKNINPALLGKMLKEIELKEGQEEVLVKKQRELKFQIEFLDKTPSEQLAVVKADATKVMEKESYVSKLQESIRQLEANELFAKNKHNDPDSREVTFYEHISYSGRLLKLGIGTHSLIAHNFNDIVTSVKVPTGLQATLYEHINNGGIKIVLTESMDNVGISSLSDKATVVVVEELPFVFGDAIKLQNDRDLLKINQEELAWLRQGLASLESQLEEVKSTATQKQTADKARRREQLQDSFDRVTAQLSQTRSELSDTNSDFIAGVTESSSQIMLPIDRDAKGLVTQAALLDFVQPVGRLNAIETCEGTVQLSYFDTQGRMRQTHYDATADSKNSIFEAWMPESYRTCLNLGTRAGVIQLNQSIDRGFELPPTWTIEAWFSYPLPETGGWNMLVSGPEGKHHIIVNGSQQLGIHIKDDPLKPVFYASGFNLDTLSNGWHHVAAVAQEGTTVFYINGKKVGDTKAKAIADAAQFLKDSPDNEAAQNKLADIQKGNFQVRETVKFIGNNGGGGQSFGKIAEVRIWGLALSSEEVAVNSKTLLSGNEPGLLAYYPLNTATGTEVRDQTGNGYNGTINGYNDTISKGGANWWACAAPIGQFDEAITKLDGINEYAVLPPESLPIGNEITITFWVKGSRSLPKHQCLLFATDANNQRVLNIHLPWADERIYFDCGNQGATYDRISKPAQAKEYKNTWTHWAFTKNATTGIMSIYCNGTLWHTESGKSIPIPATTKVYLCSDGTSLYYEGTVAQLCIWNVARSEAEIQADMCKTLTGQEPNLVSYYPLHEIKPEGLTRKVLDHVGDRHGIVTQSKTGKDMALVSNEYSTVTLDANRRKVSIMRRFFAYPSLNGATLLPDKRIEALELRWIGNAQFAPTLLGYIEGAPPVPSENLTLADDYNNATSVELTMSEDVSYNWNRSQDAGLGWSMNAFVGVDSEADAGVALGGFASVKVAKVRAGFTGNLDLNYSFQNQSSITASSALNMTDKLDLRGTVEETPKFPHLGKRFIPKNVGYALVVSATADVFITRLARSGKMVGYQIQPVEGIPPDINTITFLMNPAYTMNGSLDGMTGSSATSDRFFKHVPEMRSQYGALYPASYYRLQEAYDLKRQIEDEDKRRESYFSNFNARLVDELSLGRNIDSGDAPVTVGIPQIQDEPDPEMTKEQQQKEKENKKDKAAKDKKKAQAQQQNQQNESEKRQSEIQSKIKDTNQRVHASNSFASWQKRMEELQVWAGKRNIVNTYVWDADGGLRTESQSFANTVEHTIGGSFSMNAGLGSAGEIMAFGFAAELNAQANVNLTQTMSKTESRSKGFALNVDLGGMEYQGITDYDDKPIMPGEKVDRYRFMSFYLEGSTNHFNDFFNYVIDPEWLASNDEEARALRQTQAGKANKTWRVMHRVTYVERPALMGFGRDLRQTRTTAAISDSQHLLSKIAFLEESNRNLESKLDQILEHLKK